MKQDPIRVICLAGPTGVGKTAAALALAQALNGEVVNTDSRQVYKDFPLITAQPSAEEQKVCPHHLYGFLPTEEKLSAGRFAAWAFDTIRDIQSRGRVPLLVGGTGLYFKALLDGIAVIPPIPAAVTTSLMARYVAEGAKTLYAELCRIDSAYAQRIHFNDKQRVVRALEVYAVTDKTFTWWHNNAPAVPLVEALYMGLDCLPYTRTQADKKFATHTNATLDAIAPRLKQRIEHMLACGAVAEARNALVHCADARAPAWSGIGCRDLYAHLCEDVSLDVTKEVWLKNTRAYAKRQLTWFRADSRIQWFVPDALDCMVRRAQEYIATSL